LHGLTEERETAAIDLWSHSGDWVRVVGISRTLELRDSRSDEQFVTGERPDFVKLDFKALNQEALKHKLKLAFSLCGAIVAVIVYISASRTESHAGPMTRKSSTSKAFTKRLCNEIYVHVIRAGSLVPGPPFI
jgi:hypothetical protein